MPTNNTPRIAAFQIDDTTPIMGITFGQRWNGWHCPYFTKETCKAVIDGLGWTRPEDGDRYQWDEQTDCLTQTIYVSDGTIEEVVTDKGILVDGVRYFGLGYCNWVWSEYTAEDAKDFIQMCVNYIGLGYHPDTSFANYIDLRNGQELFSEDEAAIWEAEQEVAEEILNMSGTDIYEYALSLL